MSVTTTQNQGLAFRQAFSRMAPQIKAALPSHIPFERFERVVYMAVQKDPDLLKTDQKTLFLECQKAAADGLLPDGREGAFVRRWNSKLSKEAATWQPMVAGLMKLARNSGEIASISAHVAYKGEVFRVVLGDEEKIEHERDLNLADNAEPIAVYAVATLKNGERVREIMTWRQVEKVRDTNKHWSKGPWGNWPDQMALKTAIRRLSKRLPLSTDRDHDARLERAIERVDEEGTVIDAEPIPQTATPDPFEMASSGAMIEGEFTPPADLLGETVRQDG